jgi:hypothetical protein
MFPVASIPGLNVTPPGAAGGGGGGGGASRQPLGPIAFIDPANSTGFAADTNTGATSNNVPPGSGPILTITHLNTLLFFRSLTANRTITSLSDDATGTGLDWSTMDLGAFTLTFQLTPTVLHSGGTINAGTTAINPAAAAGGQRQTVHTSDLASFTPFVFTGLGGAAANPCLLVDTVLNNNAWIASGIGSPTASMTRPVTSATAAAPLTIGDTYKIQQGGVITLATQSPALNTGGAVVINDAAFPANSVGPNGCTYNRCSWLGPLAVGGTFNDCYFGLDMVESSDPMGAVLIVAGLLVSASIGEVNAPVTFEGDVYIAGAGLFLGPDFYSSVFITGGAVGSGIQIQDSVGPGVTVIGSQSPGLFGFGGNNGLIWGNGNTGVGVLIEAGATLGVSATLATRPTVTGTGGNFGFVQQNGSAVLTVARAFDPTTGEYTEIGGAATRTTTWAHFAATIAAGGFAFQAHNPETNAHIVGV